MKRFYILTSVLALAACGGGGHHSGSAPVRAAITPDSEAAISNSAITSMVSEVLVASDGSVITPLLNRSGSVQYNGKTYNSYRLDDVDFKFGGEDSYVKFELDDSGKIIALSKYDRSDDFTGEPEYAVSEEGRFVRTSSDGKTFAKNLYVYGFGLDNSGVSSIASDHFHDDLDFKADEGDLNPSVIKQKLKAKLRREIDKIKASQPDHTNDDIMEDAYDIYAAQIDAATSFEAPEEVYADLTVQGINNNLKYADLGFAKLVVTDGENEIETTYTPYVGGYNAVKIEPTSLETDAVFTGVAIAGIDHKKSGYGSGLDVKEGVLVRQNDATLTVRTDGSSTLAMNNLRTDDDKHWYELQVDQAANRLPTFTVSGSTDIAGKYEANAYELPGGEVTKSFTENDWKDHEQQYVKNTGSEGSGMRYSGFTETNVYGLNSNDMEATSRFGFGNEEYSDSNTKHNEVAIYGAFGGAKD